MIVIAITGGPSGGKTTLIETIHKEFGTKLAIVPEAASILYRGGFPRRKTEKGQIHVQKAIYYTQAELEGLVKEENSDKLIVCDRGSLDGIAYWPQDQNSYFKIMETTAEAECARYDWVLHLDTAPQDHYDSDNPIRTETFQEAQLLNERTKAAWQSHSQRIIIPHYQDFLSKMGIALKIIKMIKSGEPYETVKNYVIQHGYSSQFDE